jgi:hypothetical protein
LRERFDVGTGLVALGALLLLVSLFVDWFDPSGDAWAVFELTDVVLAGAAIAGLVAVLPRYTALARAMPLIAFGTLAVVAVQLIDPPPAARTDTLEAGAWLALAGATLMAMGAAMSAASISITVDVRGRERRRRTAAIDARETRDEPAPVVAQSDEATDSPPADARRARRRGAAAAGAGAADGPSGAEEPRRSRRLLDDDAGAEADAPPPAPDQPEPDPDRTQALDPVDRPKDGS